MFEKVTRTQFPLVPGLMSGTRRFGFEVGSKALAALEMDCLSLQHRRVAASGDVLQCSWHRCKHVCLARVSCLG